MTTATLSPRQVNQQVLLMIQNPSLAVPSTAPSDLKLFKDGVDVTATEPLSFTDLGFKGLSRVTFTPQSTGLYMVFAFDEIQVLVDVVPRTSESYLKNIEDESLGSWVWDKTTGHLEMIRQDGTTLANYAVTDSLTESSRERTL